MNVVARMANAADLPVLGELDTHVTSDMLANLVAAERVMVIAVDGVVVGILRWGLFWDEIPFMNLLWLLPDWRGKGLGRQLVEAWESSRLAAGHSLVLTSTVSAETAQHFYRQLGYVDSGALLLPDEAAEIIFRKHLS